MENSFVTVKEKCSHCGHEAEFFYPSNIVNKNQNIDFEHITLQSYSCYRDIIVSYCQNCHTVKHNLFDADREKDDAILNSVVYNDLLNYNYVTNHDMHFKFLQESGANIYDCYAIFCLNYNDFETEIRALFKAAELKLEIPRRYIEMLYEYGYDELDDVKAEVYEIVKEVKESAKDNYEAILELLEKVENKNVYLRLLKAETLAKLNRKEDANLYLNKIKEKYNIDNELFEFVKSKISEVEHE